jgi:hypothetical protein
MRRHSERAGVALLLGAVGFLLWREHTLVAWSEPSRAFHFGRNFFDLFGEAPLAYGLPLLIHGAVSAVGPFWAFAVNAPVLLLLVALLYLFVRDLGPGRGLGPLAGGVAAALLVFRDADLLIGLASPYRDPLAWVFVLVACLLLLRWQRGDAFAAGAGAALAAAVSTREASILMGIPFLLFGLSARRHPGALRAAGFFAAAFAVVCVPMALHNHGVSGRAWLPAAAAPGFADGDGLMAGISAAHLASTLPDALRRLAVPDTGIGLALAAVGLLAAVRRREPGLLALCLPAVLVHLLFYGCHAQPAPRSLLAVELFLLPLAGAGAAWLLGLLLTPLGDGRAARALAALAGLLALLLGAGLALERGRVEARGFRLEDALALRNHVTALLPEGVPLLAEPPLFDILRTFLDDGVELTPLAERVLSTDPKARAHVRATVQDVGQAYLVYQHPRLQQDLALEFDVESMASFRASTYGLQDELEPGFHVDRLRPWSERETRTAVAPRAQGPAALAIYVGRLSAEPRHHARLYWNDRLLDESPRDGANFYSVAVRDPDLPSSVTLVSDAPVPSRIAATLQPLSDPIAVRFDANGLRGWTQRMGGGFELEPGARHALLRGEGTLDVPTLAPDGAAFVAVAEVGIEETEAKGFHDLTIAVGDRPFHRVRLHARSQERDPEADSRVKSRVSFALHAPLVDAETTRLVWQYRGPVGGEEEPSLAIESLRIYRLELRPSLRIDVGHRDDPYLVEGFSAAAAPVDDRSLTWRATASRADLRLPLQLDPRPARLRVSYLEPPADRRAPAPRFSLNGQRILGTPHERSIHGLRRVEVDFDLEPGALLGRRVHHLTIETDRQRRAGILLDGVTLERVGSAPEG